MCIGLHVLLLDFSPKIQVLPFLLTFPCPLVFFHFILCLRVLLMESMQVQLVLEALQWTMQGTLERYLQNLKPSNASCTLQLRFNFVLTFLQICLYLPSDCFLSSSYPIVLLG
jgi:hypothetical protein